MDEQERKAIKEAFAKTKNDIFALGNELSQIRLELAELRNSIKMLDDSINSIKIQQISGYSEPETQDNYPTNQQINPTHSISPTDIPTVPYETEGLKYPNFHISTRNQGVPTDRQTNQQTDKYNENFINFNENIDKKSIKEHILDASEILDSLDRIKKEIRLKFKALTNQEMLIFSTIYQLESEFPEGVEYKQIALKLRLSESSIRDYVQRIISKGVPILKNKINNKKICLSISSELKNIASLETIIKLREI